MKKGFTLAEILITLGVIGIVAAMTIPGLITKYQQKQTVIQLKKVYSVLQQGIRMASDDYGDCEGWDYTLSQADFVNRYFSPYLKLSKVTLRYEYEYKDLKKVSKTLNNGQNVFLFPDGAIFYFWRVPAYQNKNFVFVDINGTSGPNRLGRDAFAFSFYENILTGYTQYSSNPLPGWKNPGNGGTSGQCNYNALGGVFGPGSYCSTVIMANNWQIPAGYPWK